VLDTRLRWDPASGRKPQASWMAIQWRPVTHEPLVPERIDEAPLPVRPPGHLMDSDGVVAAIRARRNGACNEPFRIVREHFDSDRGEAETQRRCRTIVLRLS